MVLYPAAFLMYLKRFIFVLFSFSLIAQESSNNIFSFKPALGLNFCQVHGDSYSGYDKLGVFIGGSVNGRINKKLSAEMGIYFSQKGSRHNPNPKIGDYSFYRLNLNYIDVPISCYYKLNDHYFASLGPSIAYLVNYSENINYTDMTGMFKFNPVEVGLNIGLGRKIKDEFYVEVRCSNSISTVRSYGVVSNVFYPNPVAQFFNKGFYNNVITLFVCYQIKVKK